VDSGSACAAGVRACGVHVSKTVKAHTIKWGDQFTIPGIEDRVFTMERGNGMWPWVSELDANGERVMSALHIGEEVIPYVN